MIPKIRVFAKAGVKTVYGGWSDTDQMFYEINDISFYDKTITVWGCHNKDCGMCDDTYKIEDVEVMMSTGLKDQNGLEIFEGDILYYEPYKTHSNDRVVEYIDGAYHGRLIRSGYSKLLAECVYETRVIGNIWEDGDLIDSERTKTY